MGEKPTYEELSKRVAELQEKNEALEEIKAFHELVLDMVPHLVSYIGKDHKFKFANKAYKKLFGMDPSSLMGMYPEDLLGEEAFQEVFKSHESALSGQEVEYESSLLLPNNRPFHFHAHYLPHVIDGRAEGFIAVVQDITKLKQTEKRLQEALLRQNEAVKAGGVGLWEWHLDTNRVLYSTEWKSQIGYDDHEISDDFEEWRSRVHPQDLEPTLKKIRESIAEKRLKHKAEFRFRHKDGTYRWILAEASILQDEAGHPVRMLGSHIDITDQKQVEEELKRSERLHREAQRVAKVGHWELDSLSGTPIWSGEIFRIFGLDPRHGPPSFSAHADIIHHEDWDLLNRSMQALSTYGTPYDIIFRILRSNGETGWMHSIASAEKDEDGRVTRMFGTAQDITDLKQAEEERNRLQNQLQQAQKMESVGRLAGGVAHDFNNKLTVIEGNAQMAMQDLDPTDPLYGDLQEIMDAADSSVEIVRQLLAFARKQTISPQVLDLNHTVEGMLKMLRRLIGEDIDLVWEPGADLWLVNMDPSQVDQILANLCVNARDAISNVGKVTIETQNVVLDEAYCREHAGFVPGQYVMLVVSDNGEGMDRETLKNVFEPFYTTKELGKGTGLGLSTVYGIAKQNNGFVNVYSEPGMGTALKVYLPRHIGEVQDRGDEMQQEVPQGQGETVFVVEDETSVLKVTERALKSLGYNVSAFGNPMDAVEAVKKYTGNIQLLMTDVVLPEMSGKDLVQAFQQISPNTKTLYTSGYTANVIAHHGVMEKGIHFIQKPFSIDSLARKVRETLDET